MYNKIALTKLNKWLCAGNIFIAILKNSLGMRIFKGLLQVFGRDCKSDKFSSAGICLINDE